jgi:hypothetical protein
VSSINTFSTTPSPVMRSDMASMQMLYSERNELRLLTWKGFHPESAAFWEWLSPEVLSPGCTQLSTEDWVLMTFL